MPIKDVLLPLATVPEPTTTGAIETAVGLARSIGARVCGVAIEVDVQVPFGVIAVPASIRGVLAAERKQSSDDAHALAATFAAIASDLGVAHEHALARCGLLEIPDRMAAEARLHDLAILPIKQGCAEDQALAEALVFESGHPLLVFPDKPKRALPTEIRSVAIAWDFSRPAARAVADAMPLITAAKQVQIFTVLGDKPIRAPASSASLAGHLGAHGVAAVAEEIKSQGKPIGKVLADYVATHAVDLLVMGAYGHSRMREFILGGATDSAFDDPPTWVLLSH